MALMLSFPGDPKHVNMNYLKNMLNNSRGEVYMTNPYPTDGEYWSTLNHLPASRDAPVEPLPTVLLQLCVRREAPQH